MKLGLAEPQVVKAAGLLGGGIAKSAQVCGALTGAILALSSRYSRSSLEEQEDPVMWQFGRRMVERFVTLTEPQGGILCRDIARVDWNDPEAVAQFRTSPESRRRICIEVVGKTAEALGELLEEAGASPG